jgi:FkbM family methyltransferase
MLLELSKYPTRLLSTLRLVLTSFFMWGLSEWLDVWFLGRQNIVNIGTRRFMVRDDTLLDKLSDMSMLFEVLVHREYGLCQIKPGDIVIDIGSHIGGFTILAGTLVGNGRVYAFEPSSKTYDTLRKNVELNGLSNVSLFKKAVGGERKRGKIYISDIINAETSVHKKTSNVEEVEILTLGDIFEENGLTHCDVLKIDCEGSEYEIIKSSKNILEKIDKIILEYHEPKYFNIPSDFGLTELVKCLENSRFNVVIKKNKHYQGLLYAERKSS